MPPCWTRSDIFCPRRMRSKAMCCWSNSSRRSNPMHPSWPKRCWTNFPVRIVCADGDVTGEYRVRDLRVLLSRDGNTSTVTVVKEHGLAYTLDPSTAYFSARLSGERGAAMDLIDAHRALLGRRLVVHDPTRALGQTLASRCTVARLKQRWLATSTGLPFPSSAPFGAHHFSKQPSGCGVGCP